MNIARLRHYILVLLMVLGAVGSLYAQSPDESKRRASALMGEGLSLQQRGQHEGALAKFDAAYEIDPNPVFQVPRTAVLVELKRYEEAHKTLRWLADHPELIGDKLHREVLARLSDVEDILRETTVEVVTPGVTGASIVLDGKLSGTTPLELKLRRGSYSLRVEKDDYVASERQIEVAGEERLKVKITLTPVPGAGPLRTWGWITMGAGIGVAAGGIGALSHYFYLQGTKDECCDVTKGSLITGSVLVGVGAGLGITSYFLFRSARSASSSKATSVLVPIPGGHAVSVGGSW